MSSTITRQNLLFGANKSWRHTPTVAVRIPEIFKNLILEYARSLDSGHAQTEISPRTDANPQPSGLSQPDLNFHSSGHALSPRTDPDIEAWELEKLIEIL